MKFLDELFWRGLIHNTTPGVENLFESGQVVGYIGFDPTAPSLTIGNLVQVMILKFFQNAGNRPIVLMGGATGLIGDPSFKNSERDLKSESEVQQNITSQLIQFQKLLNFEGDNGAILVNNFDFYKDMSAISFLRNVGKTLTVNYMASKDSVKSRMETGISFTEFSYQLLQGYDFQMLYENYECKIQMGGSDQWGNITTGTEFVRRNANGKAYAITTPLLTKTDGTKFGKSEEGNIWLDPKLTNPYKFYQFWINADDADIPKLFRYFSLKSKEEIEHLDLQMSINPREVKKILAEELTEMIHSKQDLENVIAVSNLLFGKDFNHQLVMNLDQSTLHLIKDEIGAFEISNSQIMSNPLLEDLLVEVGFFTSKSEVKRAVQAHSLSINRIKITELKSRINEFNLILNQYLFIENGKKQKAILKIIQ